MINHDKEIVEPRKKLCRIFFPKCKFNIGGNGMGMTITLNKLGVYIPFSYEVKLSELTKLLEELKGVIDNSKGNNLHDALDYLDKHWKGTSTENKCYVELKFNNKNEINYILDEVEFKNKVLSVFPDSKFETSIYNECYKKVSVYIGKTYLEFIYSSFLGTSYLNKDYKRLTKTGSALTEKYLMKLLNELKTNKQTNKGV